MAELFSVPTALIGFMGRESHYFKARTGFDACEVSHEISFCTYTVESNRVLVIPDTRDDPAYRHHPLVAGVPGIRFYAGAPIRTRDGQCIGAVSLVDYVPRAPLTVTQEKILQDLAEMVMDHLNRRRLLMIRRAALKLASSIPDAIVCSNQYDEVTFWNKGAERLTGIHGNKARGRKLGELIGAQFQHLLFEAGPPGHEGRSVENERSFILRDDGRHLPVEVASATWVEDDQYQRGFVIRGVSHRQDLRQAFQQRDFELHFQPQNDLETGKVVGAEALLRWRRPDRGLVAPGEFIGVLEVSDQALRVGDWILEASCAFAVAHHTADECFRVGVNLFPCQLHDPELADKVEALLKRYGLPPRALELEITETTILESSADILARLQRLRDHGVGIAFDDYGTGYASLSLLKKYPLSRLKIDRQFVANLGTSPDDLAIINSIIVLGQNLGLEVIAEGIEEQAQMEMLLRLGCREGQGYWFSRPVPEAEFAAL
ncbi:EAL domain-containing protein [Alcanivorax sp. ZXX171]|nr:EAL domain-containing protein [Alcanivorax sp. ZXX171]